MVRGRFGFRLMTFSAAGVGRIAVHRFYRRGFVMFGGSGVMMASLMVHGLGIRRPFMSGFTMMVRLWIAKAKKQNKDKNQNGGHDEGNCESYRFLFV